MMKDQKPKEFSRKKPNATVARSWDTGKTAFRLIAQHKTTADPTAYAVWYHYAGKKNAELNAAMDAILADERGVSSVDLRHLYETYLKEGRDAEAQLEGISQQIETKVAGGAIAGHRCHLDNHGLCFLDGCCEEPSTKRLVAGADHERARRYYRDD